MRVNWRGIRRIQSGIPTFEQQRKTHSSNSTVYFDVSATMGDAPVEFSRIFRRLRLNQKGIHRYRIRIATIQNPKSQLRRIIHRKKQ
ncbi:hypothetical protein [Halobacillus salinus]|uniref:hypothetical protein n=1 Tax=Halobacillus salinus TaxID=192814 RepID=UPI001115C9DA|nr:hypothetical protein [Halobacillus salinus]